MACEPNGPDALAELTCQGLLRSVAAHSWLPAIIQSMQDLRDTFGDRFLQYVLACDSEALAGSDWTTAQAEVLGQLQWLNAAVENEAPQQQKLTIATFLLSHNASAGTSIANAWRSACGGYVPEQSDDGDNCLVALRQMAIDTYPGFLLPIDEESPLQAYRFPATLFQHPAQSDFCHAVLDDENLCTFFPGARHGGAPLTREELLEVHSIISLSIGRGGSFQLIMLAETLLVTAYNLATLSENCAVDSYLENVQVVLENARILAGGKSVEVPVVVGLTNIVLLDGIEIRFSWGFIRKSAPDDGLFLRARKDIAAVLLVTTPVKVLDKEVFTQQSPERMAEGAERRWSAFEAWSKDLRRKIDLARYALMLSSQGEPLIGAAQKTTCIIDPLQGVSSTSWSFDVPSVAPLATLDDVTARRVEQWAERLETFPRKLDIAMRRTLSSAVDRADPVDGFIDAVLAWENMFSEAPETMLKVCGSIAHLLEREDLEARKKLYKELQDLYGRRSRVVHGAVEMSSRDAAAARRRSVSIALEAMRKLHDYPELLNIDSRARGKEILLGALDKDPS